MFNKSERKGIALMMTPVVFARVSIKEPSVTRLGNTAKFPSDSPRFSGDAFKIYQDLKAEDAQAAEMAEGKARAMFKAIGDVVVWKKGEQTLTVADMVAFLCRIRRDDHYLGYGTIKTLTKHFPGMKVKALSQGFKQLHQGSYLGFNPDTRKYWLRPKGEDVFKKAYPQAQLPPAEVRFACGDSGFPSAERRYR